MAKYGDIEQLQPPAHNCNGTMRPGLSTDCVKCNVAVVERVADAQAGAQMPKSSRQENHSKLANANEDIVVAGYTWAQLRDFSPRDLYERKIIDGKQFDLMNGKPAHVAAIDFLFPMGEPAKHDFVFGVNHGIPTCAVCFNPVYHWLHIDVKPEETSVQSPKQLLEKGLISYDYYRFLTHINPEETLVNREMPSVPQILEDAANKSREEAKGYSAVEPPHYKRGPKLVLDIGSQISTGKSVFTHALQCIEVMRHISDPRLATAFKYLWRVAFGGKKEPWDSRSQDAVNRRDIESAIWYLKDWLDNPAGDERAKLEHAIMVAERRLAQLQDVSNAEVAPTDN